MSNHISNFLNERIEAGDFPSAVYLVAEKGEVKIQDAVGHAVVEPERIPASVDTIYDLASLTKVLVTGLLCAKLIETGELALASDVSATLDPDGDRHTTLTQLLTHTSGFLAWKPFYLFVRERSEVLAEIMRTPVDRIAPQVVYSDLNFLMLTYLVEKLYGKPIDDFARDGIFEPLGLASTFFNSPRDLLRRIAASEKGNNFEKQTCLDSGYLSPVESGADGFRHDVIWGEVHDGNAYFMGGVAGHAGLFSTAEEVFKIAQQCLPKFSTLLKPETCALFTTNLTPGMNEHRSFAFQLATTPESTAGTKMSPESFGHLGFTGTSLWIDPVKERVFVLLTNRTHAHDLPFVLLNSVRRRFHDMAIDHLERNS